MAYSQLIRPLSGLGQKVLLVHCPACSPNRGDGQLFFSYITKQAYIFSFEDRTQATGLKTQSLVTFQNLLRKGLINKALVYPKIHEQRSNILSSHSLLES